MILYIIFTFLIIIVPPIVLYCYYIFSLKDIFKKNFFKSDHLVVDESIKLDRYKNYSNHISRNNLPNGQFDHVIIGSGISGLSLARLLTSANKRVLVLEAHDRIGGQMHTFQDTPTDSCPQGAEFDVGLHYTGTGLEYGSGQSLPSTIAHFMSPNPWVGLDTNFDFVGLKSKENDKYTTLKLSKEKGKVWANFLNQVKKISPNTRHKDQIALGKLQVLAHQAEGCFNAIMMLKLVPFWLLNYMSYIPYMLSFMSGFADSWGSTDDILNYINCSSGFKFLYTYATGDIGISPKKVSFGIYGALMNNFSKGAAYPHGGCIPLVNGILKQVFSVKKSEMFTNARVVDLIMEEKNKISGLVVKTGNSEKRILCNSVISTIGIVQTFEKLLASKIDYMGNKQYKVAKKLQDKHYGCFCTFVTLKKIENLPNRNYWIYLDENIHKLVSEYLNCEDISDMDVPFKFISFPSAKDPTYHDSDRFPNTSTCEIVTFMPTRFFKDLEYKSSEYESLKQRYADKIFDETLEYFEKEDPILAKKLESNVERITGASPKTFDHYINSEYGQMYGLSHKKERYYKEAGIYLRPQVIGIDGLYFGGQDVCAAGFEGALISSLITGSVVLKRNLLIESMSYHGTVKKNRKIKEKKKE